MYICWVFFRFVYLLVWQYSLKQRGEVCDNVKDKMKKISFLYCLLVLFSCGKETPMPEDTIPFRTVVVYLAANNNLAEEAYDNIDQMERALGDVDGSLLVYARLPGHNPTLYEIAGEKDKGGSSTPVKIYEPHNSSDPAVMKGVIADAQKLYPAQTYGLILWSHATGWVPPEHGSIKLKSFGDDNGRAMDIKEFSRALPNDLDFLMFDACSMASIEVLTEIADKAKYIIASPGEVVSNGMPYGKITNDLFVSGEQAYMDIAQKYIDHYDGMQGLFRSATVSLIRADQLQGLADLTKQILNSTPPLYADYNRDQLQRMDFDRFGNPLIAFDFLDFIQQNYPHFDQGIIQSYLDKLILYKGTTPYFNGFKIEKYSGLTCYVPVEENEEAVHGYYRTLKWYTASGFNQLF